MTREELIAALERAEGPSRELDEAIDYMALEQGWRQERPTYHGLAYTSSLDAALTLVRKWAGLLLVQLPDGKWQAAFYGGGGAKAIGATPVIAVCIVGLRARGEAGDA